MIKILSAKKYRELCEDLELAHSRIEHFKQNELKFIDILDKKNESQNELRKKAAFSFNIRRIVMGKMGCGKTTLIRKTIIPKLADYFVIDLCNEYLDIPDEKKLLVANRVDCEKIICEAIENNKHRIIILDNFGMLGPYVSRQILNLLRFENLNFIVVIQSARGLRDFPNLIKSVDYVFKFDTIDTMDFELWRDHSDKFIKMETRPLL